jgi:hypothetical protein
LPLLNEGKTTCDIPLFFWAGFGTLSAVLDGWMMAESEEAL